MHRSLLVVGIGSILLLGGCTHQAWFEGFKERQRQECLKHVNNDDVQRCLDEIERMSYKEYERSRSKEP